MNAIASGLEPLDQVDILAGGQRAKAADPPVGPGAEAHVRAVNVLVLAVLIRRARLVSPHIAVGDVGGMAGASW